MRSTPRAEEALPFPVTSRTLHRNSVLGLGALILAFGNCLFAAAAEKLLAHYTFDNTAADSTGNNPPAFLSNTSFTNHSLYLNGIYSFYAGYGGYDAIAYINGFSYQSFTFGVNFLPIDFLMPCTPPAGPCTSHHNIITGGYSYRWICFKYSDGHLVLKLNNWALSYEFPETYIPAGIRQQVICSVDLASKKIITYFGGIRLHDIILPDDFQFNVVGTSSEQADKQFLFSDMSNGDVFYGFVDNLMVFNAALSSDEIEALLPNAAPVVTCPPQLVLNDAAPMEITVQVSDREGDAMVVVWNLDGTAIQTNIVPATSPGFTNSLTFSGLPALGRHLLEIRATDGTNVTASLTELLVVDTTPPVMRDVVASPTVLWLPNHEFVPVNVQASVSDNSGQAWWRIVSVTSSDSPGGRSTSVAPDWIIIGDQTVLLRAEGSGRGHGRIYYISVQATDGSGNQSQVRTVTVTVPQRQGRAVEPVRGRRPH